MTERRFLVRLTHTLHPEGLPHISDLMGVVSTEDQSLAANLYNLGTTGNLQGLVRRDYHDQCG